MQNWDWKKGLRKNSVQEICMKRGLSAQKRGLRAHEWGLRADERGFRAHERGLRAIKTLMFVLFCLMRTIKHLIYCCKSHLNTIVMRYFLLIKLVRVGSKQ